VDSGHVRGLSNDHQHRDLKGLGKAVHVHDIEAAHRDALEHDGLHVGSELARTNELDHSACRVGSVSPNTTAHDSVDACRRTDDSDEEHITPVVAGKRPVVEADDVQVRLRR
jgi:hypothetical protein